MMESISILYRSFFILNLGLLHAFPTNGQSVDSLLIHENTLTRPLVVHQKQFRTNLSYGYSDYGIQYFENEKVRLSENGITEIGHRINLILEYGILENLQLGLDISYISRGSLTEAITIVNDPYYDLNFIQESRGLSDPILSIIYRLPLPRRMDFLLSAIGSMPLMTFGNKKPEHQIHLDDSGNPDANIPPYYTIQYVERSGVGSGVPVLGLGAIFKYRFSDKFAATIASQYESPQGVSENRQWLYHMVDNEFFVYASNPYQTQIPDRRLYAFTLEYQPLSNLNIYGRINKTSQKYGWTMKDDNKIKIQDTNLTSFQLGYEIIVTPKIWFDQHFILPINGQHIQAPVTINFQFRYNLIFQ